MYQEYKGTVVRLGHAMVNQVDSAWKSQPGVALQPEMLFPELKDPRKWASNMWSKTRGFLHTFGETASIIVAVFTIWRLVTNLLKWGLSACMLKEVYGCTQQLFWFPCLNLFLLRRYQQASANVRQEDKQDQPPSFKSVQPLRTAEDCENNGYSVPLRVEPKVAGGPLGVPQPRDTDSPGLTERANLWKIAG